MKLWTPLFQYSVACGTRSPNPVTESLMLSDRTKTRGPKVAISVPAKAVLERPNVVDTLTVARAPKTGVANV